MKDLIRVATSEEIRRYEEKIYPVQDVILKTISMYKENLYLTGGTALARFYWQHRLSEDLDFFINVTEADSLELLQESKRADRYARDLAGILSRQFRIVDELYEMVYSRFYVLIEDFPLKIDFVREHFHYGDLIKKPQGFYLNNLWDIGASKIAAFEDRAEIKDIIDLFYVTKQIPLQKLFELADTKRVSVAYENLLTINTQGITGNAFVTKSIDERELQNFIEVLKTETEKEVKKKEHIAKQNIEQIIAMNLWDFPQERRTINTSSIPVLKRRLSQMSLPQRNVLQKILRTVS
ncbi:MAG: nucleotidyl transferase AbiEii/AbiGii toxin family protein [bacterium]|nr:nucleotidyl transferase AbiEii/AbiGii toxin family protein [bacterium]